MSTPTQRPRRGRIPVELPADWTEARVEDLARSGRSPFGRTTLFRLTGSGELPSRLYGPRTRIIRRADWDAFIAGLPSSRSAS